MNFHIFSKQLTFESRQLFLQKLLDVWQDSKYVSGVYWSVNFVKLDNFGDFVLTLISVDLVWQSCFVRLASIIWFHM